MTEKTRAIQVNNSIPDWERNQMILEFLPDAVNFAYSRRRPFIVRTFDSREEFSNAFFAHVLRHFTVYNPERGKFKTWLIWQIRGFLSLYSRKVAGQIRSFGLISNIDYDHLTRQVDPRSTDNGIRKELVERFTGSLSNIDQRSRGMLLMRFGGYTLQEVGERFGVSRERVRQLTDDAILKIRESCGVSIPDHRAKGAIKRRELKSENGKRAYRRKRKCS